MRHVPTLAERPHPPSLTFVYSHESLQTCRRITVDRPVRWTCPRDDEHFTSEDMSQYRIQYTLDVPKLGISPLLKPVGDFRSLEHGVFSLHPDRGRSTFSTLRRGDIDSAGALRAFACSITRPPVSATIGNLRCDM